MNIESSHKFNRSGDTAYGCIEGVNLEQYQVGVVGGRKVMPIITNLRGICINLIIQCNDNILYPESTTHCVRCISIGTGIGESQLLADFNLLEKSGSAQV